MAKGARTEPGAICIERERRRRALKGGRVRKCEWYTLSPMAQQSSDICTITRGATEDVRGWVKRRRVGVCCSYWSLCRANSWCCGQRVSLQDWLLPLSKQSFHCTHVCSWPKRVPGHRRPCSLQGTQPSSMLFELDQGLADMSSLIGDGQTARVFFTAITSMS